MSSVLLALLALTGLLLVPGASAAEAPRLRPAEVVGPQVCARCHEEEFEVWKKTAHARLYESDLPLHRRPRAREIAANLGLRLIRHDSLCLDCHFTPTVSGSRVTALAGVSCESCHGAARDWVTVHNTFQGRQVRRAEETPAERRQRVERNVALGMYTPAQLFDLASRCYGCHVVPEPELVEVGGHTSGGTFDLAARIDRIRHNFVTSGRKENAPLSAGLRRKLAILGPALELRHGLDALATVPNPGGAYAQALARRVETARRDLFRLARVVSLPELDEMLAAVEGLRLEGGIPTELTHAAERVAEAARRFSRKRDGGALDALDAVTAGRVETAEGEAPADPLDVLLGAEPETGEPTAAATAAAEDMTLGGGAEAGAAPVRRSIPAIEGEVRSRIRLPLGTAETLGPYDCLSCHDHADQASWWRGDPHSRAARPLLQRDRRAVEIATLYYGRPAGGLMAKGASVCTGCHATQVSGDEAWEVADGVSCESCHGPAGRYVRAHQDANSEERRRLGMVALDEPAERAKVCAGCHYVTDRRLLAAGHPPGSSGFNLAERSRQIAHWQEAQPSAPELEAAYHQVRSRRGPVPRVEVAELDPEVVRAAVTTVDGGAARSGRGGLSGPASGHGDLRVPAARPAADPAALPEAARVPVTALPGPLPEDAAALPLDRLLLLIKDRLDALYDATGGDR